MVTSLVDGAGCGVPINARRPVRLIDASATAAAAADDDDDDSATTVDLLV